ncbi:MAG: glutamate--tRNA ligase [Bacteroidia bacterium]|nr:glutamate--tRNA ligase [Bacteroidia bacterium]
MSDSIRVRFAPSPTGPLHIGGVRTALFNYLFAKKHNGVFVLRIEDTDQSRFVPGAEEYITESLSWCRIPFDEGPGKDGGYGPYRQSERQHLYKKYADELIASGHAYYAFDSNEELQGLRKTAESKGESFIYNWHNRMRLNNSLALPEKEVQNLLDTGVDYVIRFKSPSEGAVVFTDLIRGTIEIDCSLLDDKVLFKSDGMPTYHLANIVDDHLMEISHVIRGEEWLPSLALHHQLYEAFAWTPPKFAHLPLILKPTGKGKLSKRDGDKLGFPVFPLEWTDHQTGDLSRGYREDGYFPETVINFLAFLGWNPGTEQEIFSLEELINAFELERVHKGGARFDPDKTRWYNHHYLQQQPDSELAGAFIASRDELGVDQMLYTEKVVGLIKERAHFVSEFWELGHYFYVAPDSFDTKGLKKAMKDDTPNLLRELSEHISSVSFDSAKTIRQSIRDWIEAKEIGFGKVMMPLRLSLVGALQGPDVFDIMSMIGRDESLSRVNALLNTID